MTTKENLSSRTKETEVNEHETLLDVKKVVYVYRNEEWRTEAEIKGNFPSLRLSEEKGKVTFSGCATRSRMSLIPKSDTRNERTSWVKKKKEKKKKNHRENGKIKTIILLLQPSWNNACRKLLGFGSIEFP